MASLPAYLASLAMSYCVRSNSNVYFPGVSMMLSAFYYLFGWVLHYRQHGADALTLKWRVPGVSEFDLEPKK